MLGKPPWLDLEVYNIFALSSFIPYPCAVENGSRVLEKRRHGQGIATPCCQSVEDKPDFIGVGACHVKIQRIFEQICFDHVQVASTNW